MQNAEDPQTPGEKRRTFRLVYSPLSPALCKHSRTKKRRTCIESFRQSGLRRSDTLLEAVVTLPDVTQALCLPALWADWTHRGRLTANYGLCHPSCTVVVRELLQGLYSGVKEGCQEENFIIQFCIHRLLLWAVSVNWVRFVAVLITRALVCWCPYKKPCYVNVLMGRALLFWGSMLGLLMFGNPKILQGPGKPSWSRSLSCVVK